MSHGRLQLALYAALGVVLVLLGIRAMHGVADEGAAPGGVSLETAPVGSGEGFAGGGTDVVVHVAGAVRESGVYRLPAGSRVTDAVERAGGPTDEANVDAINLAARLADGQQVVVPSTETASADPADPESGPISLGTADQAALETIEGIGPVTAADILAYRDEHGGIASIDELDEVPGIGPTTLDSLRDRLQP